jgi:AraC-like DNA-binding protein
MSWPNRRNIASMRALTRLAEQFSISLATCLHQTGVSIHQLNDPYAQVDATQELQLVTNLINAYGGYQPELGLQAGRYYHLDTYGIWGFALVSSPTLHEAIDLGLRYFDLTFAFSQVRLEQHEDEAILILDGDKIPAICRQFLLERDMSSMMTMLEELFNTKAPLRHVCFNYPPPNDLSAYQRIFGLTPQFNASYTGISFARGFLSTPIPQSNITTAKLCETQCKELLSQRQQRTGVSAKVRDLLLRHPQSMPNMELVAEHLCISSRTLRRQLKAEGVSYRELVDEVRMTLAEALLKIGGLNLEEIGIRLGYSEVSNFLHAFKRCKQQTPSQFRATLC